MHLSLTGSRMYGSGTGPMRETRQCYVHLCCDLAPLEGATGADLGEACKPCQAS